MIDSGRLSVLPALHWTALQAVTKWRIDPAEAAVEQAFTCRVGKYLLLFRWLVLVGGGRLDDLIPICSWAVCLA